MRRRAIPVLLLLGALGAAWIGPAAAKPGRPRRTTPPPRRAAPAPAAPAPAPAGATVRVLVRSTGPAMQVSWGRQHLGSTPLSLTRPRDSGPMDLVLHAAGCFPMHVRAYTSKDDTIVVKPTRLKDKMNLLGARAEPPPESDGGVPPAEGTKPAASRPAPGP
jgi:hypothetical protein